MKAFSAVAVVCVDGEPKNPIADFQFPILRQAAD